jgi:mgtE-like transporter
MVIYSVRRIVLESYPILLTCAFIGFFAGYVLEANIRKIEAVPLILMMVPPINGIGGNVGSILGARLASALHIGTVDPKFKRQAALDGNIKASVFMGVGVFVYLGALFFAIALMGGEAPAESIRLMLSLFIAGMFLMPVVLLSTVVSTFLSFSKGLDPDNLVIPLITSIIDVSGVMCLLAAIKIMGV